MPILENYLVAKQHVKQLPKSEPCLTPGPGAPPRNISSWFVEMVRGASTHPSSTDDGLDTMEKKQMR